MCFLLRGRRVIFLMFFMCVKGYELKMRLNSGIQLHVHERWRKECLVTTGKGWVTVMLWNHSYKKKLMKVMYNAQRNGYIGKCTSVWPKLFIYFLPYLIIRALLLCKNISFQKFWEISLNMVFFHPDAKEQEISQIIVFTFTRTRLSLNHLFWRSADMSLNVQHH